MRLIDADAAKKALVGWETDPTDGEIEWAIDHIPTIEAEPVQHAEWIPCVINGKQTRIFMTCSGCRRYQWPRNEIPLFRRCPKCGAIMDGGSKARDK